MCLVCSLGGLHEHLSDQTSMHMVENCSYMFKIEGKCARFRLGQAALTAGVDLT